MSAIGSDPNPPRRPQRIRRRRRSMRRRLLDSMMPFLVVFGMTVFAAGLVQVVEIGAAANSKRLSAYDLDTRAAMRPMVEKPIDFELAQDAYQDLMRRHSENRQRAPKPQNQIAYQLELQNEAMRELSGLPSGQLPQSSDPNDVLDWTLFEEGGGDPRSALKRGTGSGR